MVSMELIDFLVATTIVEKGLIMKLLNFMSKRLNSTLSWM